MQRRKHQARATTRQADPGNPLWIIAIAMAIFFVAATAILSLG